MGEYIAQMAPMLGVAGALVAWLAQIRETRSGHGFLPDMALALIGSGVAGSLFTMGTLAYATGVGMPGMVVVGAVGAVAAIAMQRAVWPDTGAA